MDYLTTEQNNPDSIAIDQMEPIEIARLMNLEDHKVLQAVDKVLPAIAQAIQTVTQRIENGGRLIYIGAGTSGRLGVLDASECPPTFNTPPSLVVGLIAGGQRALTTAIEGAEDNAQAGAEDLRGVNLKTLRLLNLLLLPKNITNYLFIESKNLKYYHWFDSLSD